MKIAGSICDSSVRLSHIGIWQLVEDSVTEYMHGLGVDGLATIRNYNAMWVFSAVRARIFRRPAWEEEVCVSTCFVGREKVRLGIETRFVTPAGEPLILVRTEAVVVDLQDKRMRRLESVGIDATIPFSAPEAGFERIRFPAEGYETVDTLVTRSTNIDYLHHVNNIEYLRFLLNTFSNAQLEAEELEQLELEYREQAYEGETLTVRRAAADGAQYFKICRGETVIVRAKLCAHQQ